jgi:hypothetical protein
MYIHYTDTKQHTFNSFLISFLPSFFSSFAQYFIEVFLHIFSWMSDLILCHFWQECFFTDCLESNKLMWTESSTFLSKLIFIKFLFSFSFNVNSMFFLKVTNFSLLFCLILRSTGFFWLMWVYFQFRFCFMKGLNAFVRWALLIDWVWFCGECIPVMFFVTCSWMKGLVQDTSNNPETEVVLQMKFSLWNTRWLKRNRV